MVAWFLILLFSLQFEEYKYSAALFSALFNYGSNAAICSAYLFVVSLAMCPYGFKPDSEYSDHCLTTLILQI